MNFNVSGGNENARINIEVSETGGITEAELTAVLTKPRHLKELRCPGNFLRWIAIQPGAPLYATTILFSLTGRRAAPLASLRAGCRCTGFCRSAGKTVF